MGLAQRLSNSIIIRRKVPPRLLVILGMIGLGHMLYGGMWDASSHILEAPEFFWSIQHVAVYLGVAMIAVSAVAGGIILVQNGAPHRATTGIRLVISGSLLQLAAGYADSVSHDMWGIDGLLSWSHQIFGDGTRSQCSRDISGFKVRPRCKIKNPAAVFDSVHPNVRIMACVQPVPAARGTRNVHSSL